jgi:alkanesulfonate monooxygenase SsuD/methylene tetrahydromethanopterin reductase-like flavin-dependent oxidoreductase (luciferase family)
MRMGLFVSNGIGGDWQDRDPVQMWNRALEIARLADSLGFDAVWVPDHLQNLREEIETPTAEAFMILTAIAGVTERVTLSPGVACVPFRNPALLMKMMATLDVASNGRAEIAVGAGWHEPEFEGYGYGFPSAKVRLAMLREGLEIITRMQQPGRPSFEGEHFRINEVICAPKSVTQPRMPVIIGGNGQKVTWRLAAKYADELNLDGPTVDQIEEWLPIVRQRCEEIDRDPATLPVSALHFWRGVKGQERVEALQRMKEAGMHRLQSGNDRATLDSDEPLHELAEDCRAAGVELLA